MLIEVLIDILVEGPLLLMETFSRRSKCPKCGNRLKYMPQIKERVQCVMCERIWVKNKDGQLLALGSDR